MKNELNERAPSSKGIAHAPPGALSGRADGLQPAPSYRSTPPQRQEFAAKPPRSQSPTRNRTSAGGAPTSTLGAPIAVESTSEPFGIRFTQSLSHRSFEESQDAQGFGGHSQNSTLSAKGGSGIPCQDYHDYRHDGLPFQDDSYPVKPRFVLSEKLSWTVFGSFVLALLMIGPLCNSIILLDDKVFKYFLGHGLPVGIFVSMLCILLSYVATLSLFFKFAKEEKRSEQSLLFIASVFVTLVGVACMLLSMYPHREVTSLQADIWENCKGSPRTYALYREYHLLSQMRARPSCHKMQSVEQCEGYVANPEATALKAMELGYHCSGFCVFDADFDGDLAPALFSKERYQGSCDGATARTVGNFFCEVLTQIFFTGGALVAFSVVIGLVKAIEVVWMMRLFSPLERDNEGSGLGSQPSSRKSSYGSTPSTPSMTARQVSSQGV
eukprot:gnl/TRDRNA2_/TRDRNA2_36586_c0_seq1.p1 gnl/TRDRNA2_/TRDRNA2_36586_c0~~gnl/TRDRNA2_/TRDRNA2_36586_c0_seq1.p1  ORF type:complete len:440 (-),score=53.88 gnl/TRDRNA2_/TRDRNA2_36586_c0_seq1:39-1358(-)